VNNGDQAANFIYLLGVLVLVASALMVRRIPMRQGFKMLAAWILIFLAIFIIFALRSDFAALGDRLMQAIQGPATPVQQGETLRVRQALDGHFWVDARLNGEPVRFLIDSGATTTSISTATARRVGIEPSGGFPVVVQTANGTTTVQRGRAQRVEVGSIVREDLAVHISDGFGETNVLGMNFLSSLSGWGVEGGWLILRP
jgi:aspartyl protease family protein